MYITLDLGLRLKKLDTWNGQQKNRQFVHNNIVITKPFVQCHMHISRFEIFVKYM